MAFRLKWINPGGSFGFSSSLLCWIKQRIGCYIKQQQQNQGFLTTRTHTHRDIYIYTYIYIYVYIKQSMFRAASNDGTPKTTYIYIYIHIHTWEQHERQWRHDTHDKHQEHRTRGPTTRNGRACWRRPQMQPAERLSGRRCRLRRETRSGEVLARQGTYHEPHVSWEQDIHCELKYLRIMSPASAFQFF